MSAKSFVGQVVSDKMERTVVVVVDSFRHHPRYHKRYRVRRKFKADDRLGTKVGDKVEIVETKPFSKEKSWRVVRIID